jgi:hypothetical protein
MMISAMQYNIVRLALVEYVRWLGFVYLLDFRYRHVCTYSYIYTLFIFTLYLFMLILQLVPVDVELACKIKNLIIIFLSQYIITLNYLIHRNKVN